MSYKKINKKRLLNTTVLCNINIAIWLLLLVKPKTCTNIRRSGDYCVRNEISFPVNTNCMFFFKNVLKPAWRWPWEVETRSCIHIIQNCCVWWPFVFISLWWWIFGESQNMWLWLKYKLCLTDIILVSVDCSLLTPWCEVWGTSTLVSAA